MMVKHSFYPGLYTSLLLLALVLTPWPANLTADTKLDSLLPVCHSCHGPDGRPVDANTPVLAGQEYYYLYVQLKDYKAGRRANPVMSSMVQNLSKDDMKALAEHFSSQEWPRLVFEIENEKVATGGTALAAGQCSQCHSTYQGDSRVPRLAGQQLAYLEQTMKDFKNKARLNSPAKGSLMDSFSDKDLEGMAHYLSNL